MTDRIFNKESDRCGLSRARVGGRSGSQTPKALLSLFRYQLARHSGTCSSKQ